MRKRMAGCLLALLFLQASFTHAQTFNVTTYSAAAGFKGSSIQSIFADSFGYLWISTYSDLLRFDGNTFKRFGYAEGVTGTLNTIIFEDNSHKLWGTSGSGGGNVIICFYEGRFLRFHFNEKDSVSYVFSFYQDADTSIHVCTNNGVFSLHNNQLQKAYIPVDKKYLPVRNAVPGKNGTMYYCTPSAVFEKSGSITKVIADAPAASAFNMILPVGNNICMVALDKLLLYDGKAVKDISGNRFRNDYIIQAASNHSGGVYACGIDSGLYYFDNIGAHPVHTKEKLTIELVHGICEDKEKNVWIGSLKLYRLNKLYTEHFTQANGLEGTNTHSVLFTKSGAGYFGQESFTTYRNQEFIPASTLLNKEDNLKFYAHAAYFMQDDEQGRIWMMLNPNLLVRYSGNRIESLNKQFNPQNQNMGQLVFDRTDSSMYIALDSIVRIKNERIVEKIPLPAEKNYGKPMCLCFDQAHRLWTGTKKGAIGYINLPSGKFYSLDEYDNNERIQKIICSADGTVWIATLGNGILHCGVNSKGEMTLISTLTEKAGLPSNTIWDVVFDRQQFLWATTSGGLVKYKIVTKDKKDSVINSYLFTEDDGLNSSSFIDTHLGFDSTGNVWLTTYDGVYKIDSKANFNNPLPPVVQIERLQIIDDSTNGNRFAKATSPYFNLPIHPIIPFKNNTVTIYYNSIAYTQRDQVECAYKLEGIYDEWTLVNPSSSISFSNLAAGKYVFHVRSRRKNYAWSREATFAFTIKQPYWKTWWFSLLIVVLASSVLIIAFRIRLQQVHRKATLQSQLQQLEMQALKARMNPHFIYNAMNSIQSLIVSNDPENAVRYLGKFAKLLRQVLDNSDQQLITLEQELSSLKLYIELETLRIDVDFDFIFHVDENISTTNEFIPPLTLQPFAENALWHGLSNKKGIKKLSVHISIEGSYLVSTMIDNGIGRTKSMELKIKNAIINPSKGLNITERRLALLNNSHRDAVTIVDLYDNDGGAAGTKVIIKILRTA